MKKMRSNGSMGIWQKRIILHQVGKDIAKTSKSALKSRLFPKIRRKKLKCAVLFAKMGPFRKNRSKDLHNRFRIRQRAAFSQKDLQF